MSSSNDMTACPVDHKARETWLEAGREQRQEQPKKTTNTSSPLPASCDSSQMDQSPSAAVQPKFSRSRLSTDREVSTIPRAGLTATADAPSPNAQSTEPHTSSSGHWVYPSEAQFFAAMRRKNHNNARPSDMSSIIPIHNAVNERTWQSILQWESGRGGGACGGPRLVSFSGDSQKLTPRARWYGMLGYQAPFDRHDWVVERCGKKVEYVIDFYAGKAGTGDVDGKKPLSFHLDVRPKLNSLEGWKMRAEKYWGLGPPR
ncbi:MAG: Cytochrome c1 heme lyase [Chrysothrix sp. TS-e1954]|nr:MAG: Cytochrome c1 heme lyase [Chrysothrix sp. TS-e1954]